jgi:hypothetical protein
MSLTGTVSVPVQQHLSVSNGAVLRGIIDAETVDLDMSEREPIRILCTKVRSDRLKLPPDHTPYSNTYSPVVEAVC